MSSTSRHVGGGHMWDELLRVDWRNLHRAYGRADDAPAMLRHMISDEPDRRHKGWDYFWGSLHHQGDYYNSTVAVVPFLIEAAANPAAHGRSRILKALEQLWNNTAGREGYPLVPEPPGGVDVPTPLLGDAAFAAAKVRGILEPPDDPPDPDEDAFRSSRPADLCAWQTGRAVLAGQPTYLRLLDDADPDVVRTAAGLLGVWADTRDAAREAMARVAGQVADPAVQVRLILEFGESNSEAPSPKLAGWLAEGQPLEVRTAAALAWAWATSPAPVPPAVVTVLEEASRPKCKVFPNLPEIGVYSNWGLPPNLAWLVLRLAKSSDKQLRWRMVQNFQHETETVADLPLGEVVPVLLACLTDRFGRVRNAAAQGLVHRGPSVLAEFPDAIDTLLDALQPHTSENWRDECPGLDSDAEACGHIAHLLACGADLLTAKQKRAALARIKAASERFRGKDNEYVMVGSCGHNAHDYLRRQHKHLAKPAKKTLVRLLVEIAFPGNQDRFRPLLDADRDLADRYERSPPAFLASLRNHLLKSTPTGRGAVEWLRKLGPVAAFALKDLDAKAATISPPAAAWELVRVAKFIRWSKRVKSLPPVKKTRVAPTVSDWLARLGGEDAYTRAVAAESLTAVSEMDPVQKQQAVAALQRLLKDDASAEFGVKGRYEAAGRLYFWRMERKAPRASAALALFAFGYQPTDGSLFRALLAEAGRAAVVCGEKVIPRRFPLDLWRLAVQGAGGMGKCERLFGRLLKDLDARPYSDEVNVQYACKDEVERVVAALTRRKSYGRPGRSDGRAWIPPRLYFTFFSP